MEEKTSCGIVLASRRVPQRCADCMKGLGLLCSEPVVSGCHVPGRMAPRGRAAPAEPVPTAQAPAAPATFTDGPHMMPPDDAGRRVHRGLESWDTCASSLSPRRGRAACKEFLTRTVDLLYCTWALLLRRSTQPCHFHPQLLLHHSLRGYDL